jgi:hypothetical protein
VPAIKFIIFYSGPSLFITFYCDLNFLSVCIHVFRSFIVTGSVRILNFMDNLSSYGHIQTFTASSDVIYRTACVTVNQKGDLYNTAVILGVTREGKMYRNLKHLMT